MQTACYDYHSQITARMDEHFKELGFLSNGNSRKSAISAMITFTTLGSILLSLLVLANPIHGDKLLARRHTTVYPTDLCGMNGNISNASSLIGAASGSVIFTNASAATYNFGSILTDVTAVTLTIGDTDRDQYIGIVPFSVDADGTCLTGNANDPGDAGAAWFFIDGPGNFTTPLRFAGDNFRYLSLLHNTTGAVQVRSLNVESECH
jgi:hypothetical protein